MLRWLLALSRAACAAVAFVAAGCWDEGSGGNGPAPVQITMAAHPARMVGTPVWLQGDVECPECADYTAWTYGTTCPEFTCPAVESAVWWTNQSTAATGPAMHGVWPSCQCGTWLWVNYCSASCSHSWSASVPLAYGGNEIVISATAPGFAQGNESTLVERVPVSPAWLAPLAGSGTVTLAWTASEGATSYTLYWSTTAHDTSGSCTRIRNVSSPYTHAGLASGVPHYYFVTALAGDAEGFDSERLAVTPQ